MGRVALAEIDEVCLLGVRERPETWRRVALLRAMGVTSGDDRPPTAGRIADFLSGAADAAAEGGCVALALQAAAREAAQVADGALVVVGEGPRRLGLAEAGRSCAEALAG
eukprot:511151-Pleurochrysis_carterae.AAC.1